MERYHFEVAECVRNNVLTKQTKPESINAINNFTDKNIPSSDKERFVEVVQTELLSLHLGNIAKFKILPAEFEGWKLVWG